MIFKVVVQVIREELRGFRPALFFYEPFGFF